MTPEQYKKLNELERISSNIRGLIIDRTISIEAAISQILIDLLSNDKTRDSIDKYLFSDTLTFDSKIKLFNSLFKAKAFTYEGDGRKIGESLDIIRNVRNLIAHSMLNTSIEFLEKTDLKTVEYFSYRERGVSVLKIIIGGDDYDDKNLEYGENLVISMINYLIEILDSFSKAS